MLAIKPNPEMSMKAEPMRVYWAEAGGGNLEWPKGMLVVALGEHDDLQKALWKYGKHLTSCRRNADMTSWCDCGWDKIRETLAPPPSKMCPECHAVGGPDGVTNCATCRGDFWATPNPEAK
jgi:hypothetical protein